jgi:hypothetical protein
VLLELTVRRGREGRDADLEEEWMKKERKGKEEGREQVGVLGILWTVEEEGMISMKEGRSERDGGR